MLNAPLISTPDYRTSISIAQLLDFVNRYFPDILPESVLRHYGYDARPDGEIGEDALYSGRDSYDSETKKQRKSKKSSEKMKKRENNAA